MTTDYIGAPWHWALFLLLILALLALDLGVFHRRAHEVTVREAGVWSCVWIGLALLFNAGVYISFGPERAVEFATGYLLEKALAVDNLFVFVLIFSAFSIPAVHQHRVLFWGILGALVLRAAFIGLGSAVLARFHWAIYVFGAFLTITGLKLLWSRGEEPAPEQNRIVGIVQRFVPFTLDHSDGKFVRRQGGRWLATPLLLALLAVEVSDIVFAVDSIPAIFAVTREPFIVFTSNIFAILGLRSLYFLLAAVLDRFVYLKHGLAIVLVFIGLKMLLSEIRPVPVGASLAVVAVVLGGAVTLSWLRTRRVHRSQDPSAEEVPLGVDSNAIGSRAVGGSRPLSHLAGPSPNSPRTP